MTASSSRSGSRILVIDDDAEVREVLAASLTNDGHVVVGVGTAAMARGMLAAEEFDIALVDLRLPDADGIDLAMELKSRQVAQFFPVVLITGDDDSEERLRGFRAGCDEFLSKPVSLFELGARIDTLLMRRRQHAELAAANGELRELHARKQVLAALVVHDLRNPLSALQGNVDLISEELATTDNQIVRECLADCRDLAQKSLSLVAGLLDVEELEEGLLIAEPVEANVAEFCHHAARHHGATIKMRQLTLEFRVAPGLTARLDVDLVGRLVENLLDNAVRYAPRKGMVVVSGAHEDGALVVRVGNNGPAVPIEERARIFDRYYRLEARRSSARANRGLGLYFCKLVAEVHGGTIAIEELPELPTCFAVYLPQ
ncbi:MAG TPA: response regulator [Kofleriaceae bacterium]|nr:response regulator [Kofleriaceae bacterium]